MKRRAEAILEAWRIRSRGRLPLLVLGARQVGKTHLLREFGRTHYDTVAYLNLETNPRAGAYFDGEIAPERLIAYLEAETGQRIVPGRSLVILDEIQTVPRALTALKYFAEDAPGYHVVGAGSLLGVALNRSEQSYPVGNVTSLTLHPLDLEEFWWAVGEDGLSDQVHQAYEDRTPLPSPVHERALEWYRRYLVVGGMPRVVNEYVASGSTVGVGDIQRGIIGDYTADMAKYATPSEAVKIRAAYTSLPAQLAKDNHKFQYKLAARGGTAAIFGAAIDWLVFAGVALRCDRATQGRIPLAAYSDLAAFRLYMGDTGLLTHASGLPTGLVLHPGGAGVSFVGALTENYVAQALTSRGLPLYYWTSNGRAEVDYLLQCEDGVVPLEVKAADNVRSRSLSVFTQEYPVPYALRLSGKNFGTEGPLRSVPLYAAHCIAPASVG